MMWECDGDSSVGTPRNTVAVSDLLEPPVVLIGVQPNPPVLLLAPGELHAEDISVPFRDWAVFGGN